MKVNRFYNMPGIRGDFSLSLGNPRGNNFYDSPKYCFQELPLSKRKPESPFSSLGIMLLGFVLTSSAIKRLEEVFS